VEGLIGAQQHTAHNIQLYQNEDEIICKFLNFWDFCIY